MINKKISIYIFLTFLALILLSYLSALSTVTVEVTIFNILLAELAFAFLVNSLVFPKANNLRVINISVKYLLTIAGFFAIISFLPHSGDEHIFSYGDYQGLVPFSVRINAFALLMTNIFASFVIIINDKLKKVKEDKVFFSYQKSNLNQTLWGDEKDPEKLEKAVKSKEIASELKSEVNEIFDVYLEKFEDDKDSETQNKKLENFENALVKHINPQIEAALCLDENFNHLDNSIFKWENLDKDEIAVLFDNLNKSSEAASTGKLCQCLFSVENSWYIIAQYRGMFLILKSRNSDFSNLLEVSYKVFKSLG